MDDRGEAPSRPSWTPGPWMVGGLILGAYWTLKGYHSLDGDQAHRLPLLLHRLDPRLYAADPFVRSFDVFNPHRGSLGLVWGFSRLVGLSAALTILFVLTFAASVNGVARLARAAWPDLGRRAGLVAVGLFLTAKAGNIGTNHLFESMLLDRLMGLALAWLAAAVVVEDPRRGRSFSALAIGLAAVVHPSLGLQVGLIFAGAWLAWALVGASTGVPWRLAFGASLATGLAVLPGLALNLAPFGSLREGLSPEKFWLLTVELQSPQHMLPHLWRTPQWLAAGCYLFLAAGALRGLTTARRSAFLPFLERGSRVDGRETDFIQFPATLIRPSAPPSRGRKDDRRRPSESANLSMPAAGPRLRLVVMLGVVLFWLVGSWFAVEVFRHVGATVFQPFRMATFARGLALVCASGRVLALWDRGDGWGRLRAALIPLGLTGDWLLVVVVCVEAATTLAERFSPASGRVVFVGSLAIGCLYLTRHDTERGHLPLLGLVAAGLLLEVWRARRASESGRVWTARRWRWAMVVAWATPVAALVAGLLPGDRAAAANPIVRALVARCRFTASPIGDVENLASWCREHTPVDARFIGPPGPKGFRLWSRRSLAFNRAGSPYHARGIDDWYRRFADHVDFHGTAVEFVHAYLEGRHRLEARYDAMTDAQRAGLAVRQGADHVVALRPTSDEENSDGPLELLHVEGEYAVYRVRSAPAVVAHRH